MNTVETTGKTLEEALTLAGEELGLPSEALDYEIVGEPKRILGVLGTGQYTVRAWAKTASLGDEPEEEAPAAQAEAEEPEAAAPAAALVEPKIPEGELTAAVVAEHARDITQHVLGLMGLEGTVRVQKVEGENLELAIESPESQGLLIGHHGDTLDALQYLVSIGANRGVQGPGFRLSIDVEDYRERQAEMLTQLAVRHADEAVASGQEAVMPNLKAYERRIVHMALVDRKDIETYSEGEGNDRVLVISPLTAPPPAEPEE